MTHHMRQKNFTFGGNPLSHQIWATLEENPLSCQIWATLEEIHCLTIYGLLWRKSFVSPNMGYFGGNIHFGVNQ